MEQQVLIVGLGNPGREYAHTRHYAGFLVVEELARRWQVGWSLESRFQARLARADRPAARVWLCEPQTFMNASGEAVRRVMDFHRVPAAQVMVVADDADLPFGEIRLRPKGSSGGHHGLESVGQQLGTTEFARQKIGISGQRRADGRREISGHVLGRFSAAEQPRLEKILGRAADQLEAWLRDGALKAMNDFNGVVDLAEE